MLPIIETKDGLFEFTTELEGCGNCDMQDICMRGKKLYNSRAWLCELFAPGKNGNFKKIDAVGVSLTKELSIEDKVYQ